ncbi:MAG: murein biosynthesis integral membrane protein MurJ [Gammaproteobacteria bacterium]
MSRALIKSTSTVSSMTMISRVLGFVRDMVAAQIYGVNAAMDAFNIAFKIPNFMRNLFAEGSFSQAFVPTLSEYRQTRTESEVKAFINHITGCLGLILLIITIIAVIASPLLVKVSAPGLEPLRFHYASEMLRVTFPYLMLISLTALCGSILNTYSSFAIPAFTPALLNIVLIVAAVWGSQYFSIPVEAQAWGVLIAGFVQLLFQLPFLKQRGLLPFPIAKWRDPGVQRVLLLMVPAIFGASVGQISLFLNTIFVSFLKVGSVSWLYYSERLAYFPLGVFGVALATVVLPHLSRKHAEQSPEKFKSALDWGIRCNLLIGIPCSIVLLFFAAPIIATLFLYGKFHVYDLLMSKKSLITYSFGLQAFMLVKVLSTAFYARKNIKTPVRFAIITVGINIILNLLLMKPLAHAGLALATSLSAWFNVFLLWFTLIKQKVYVFEKRWFLFMSRLIFANAVVALLLWFGEGTLSQWVDWHWYQRMTHLTFWLISAIIVYFISLWLSGIRFSDFRAID